MAHNIQILENGVACYVENAAKERAWHELGTTYDRPLTAKEAIEGAHANFVVEGRELFYMTSELKEYIDNGLDIPSELLTTLFRKVENKKANVRNDLQTCLGVVGKDYGIVQNEHAFDFVDMLTSGQLGGEIPTIESAGVLGQGERIFITAKFAEPIIINNKTDDHVDMYVVFTTSHNGEGAVTCMITPVRVVCNNTLNMAFSHNCGKLSLRHTINVNNRLDLTNKENAQMAFKALNLYNLYKKEFEEKLQYLQKVKFTDKQVEEILVKSLLPSSAYATYLAANKNLQIDEISTRSKNIVANVTDSLFGGIGQSLLEKGNGLWLVNGMTSYYQNHANWSSEEQKFDSIMDGTVNNKLNALYDTIEAFAV